MKLEEVNEVISQLESQLPQMQTRLQQAYGYRQALVDQEKVGEQQPKEDKNESKK